MPPNPRDYDRFCLTVFNPKENKEGLNQAIQIQIDKKKNALCIAEGKIDILTSKVKGASNQDVVGATPKGMGIVFVSKLPESSEENVAVYPYFKAKREVSLTPKRLNISTGLNPEKIPAQVKILFEQTQKYLKGNGLLAFNAKMEGEYEGLNGGTRETTLLAALETLIDRLKRPKPEFQPVPQRSF